MYHSHLNQVPTHHARNINSDLNNWKFSDFRKLFFVFLSTENCVKVDWFLKQRNTAISIQFPPHFSPIHVLYRWKRKSEESYFFHSHFSNFYSPKKNMTEKSEKNRFLHVQFSSILRALYFSESYEILRVQYTYISVIIHEIVFSFRSENQRNTQVSKLLVFP